MFKYLKNSNYSFMFYFMFGCIYPDMFEIYKRRLSRDLAVGRYIPNAKPYKE
jgi:hypothetical protein